MKNFLRLRSQLALVEKRPSKRLFFQGPIVGETGLYLTRSFDHELLKIDGQRVLWCTSTLPLVQFRVGRAVPGGLVVGMGAAQGIAAFREDTGTLAWKRLDLGGLVPQGGRLLSMMDGVALVEVDPSTGDERRRLPIGDEHMVGVADGEMVLMPDHHGAFDEHQDRESARAYRCLSLETGEILWERNLAKEAWEAAGQSRHFVTNLMPGSLGESWIGRWRQSTFGSSRKDGSLLWFAKDIECGPRADVKDGRVFGMPPGGGRFYVLDERTGAMLAQHDGSGLEGVAYPRPAVFLGEYAIYGMESGHLAVFDPRDARLVWVKRHNAPLSDVRVIEGLVYVTTGKGELLVYEPTA
jgi:outer membrane protein assembly factor BamB